MTRPSLTLAASAVWLAGCSWVLPHPSASPPDRGMAQCPLELAQARRGLPDTVPARGSPALLILRKSAADTDRLVRNGDAVFFVATHPGMSRGLNSLAQSAPPSPLAVWRIEAQDSNGGALAAGAPIRDASIVRLRQAKGPGYLEIRNDAQSLAARADQAAAFVLYKVDAPDSTRPTTCDGQLRDGDFVLAKTVAAPSWVDISAAGEFIVRPYPASGPPRCNPQKERCLNDKDGGLVCAWAFCAAD